MGAPATLIATLLALAAAVPAHAGSFTANPIRLTLPAGAASTSLSLENRGAEVVLIQAELMAWTQVDGRDVLAPSTDLIVSPPIFKVAPGAAQTVRVGVPRPLTGEREVAYRLFLAEVPAPPAPGEQGIGVALRLGLPVFVLPAKPAPQLAWQARPEGAQIRLTLTNSGNVHVQALESRLAREDGSVIAQQQLASYVLAGQTRSWVIQSKQPWRGEKLTLTVDTPGGPVKAELASTRP